MLESLQHTALDAKDEQKAYYRLVRHSAREKSEVSKRYLKNLVRRELVSAPLVPLSLQTLVQR